MDYKEMLERAKKEIPEAKTSGERFVVPKVTGHIQGNRTIVNNFRQIADALGRESEHLLKYILKELATPGELRENELIIGTKVSSQRINEKIEEYVNKYVLCPECKRPDTKLIKEGDVSFIRCSACGARKPAG